MGCSRSLCGSRNFFSFSSSLGLDCFMLLKLDVAEVCSLEVLLVFIMGIPIAVRMASLY